MSTTGKTLLVAIMLIALGFTASKCVQTTCGQDNQSIASCTQEQEDCDAEDWKTYDKDCGRRSPAPRRSTAPATKQSVIPGKRA